MSQVNTDLNETVEGQAQADAPNIQSETTNAGSQDHAGSGEVVTEIETAEVVEETPAPTPTEEVESIKELDQYEAMKARLNGNPDVLATPTPTQEPEKVVEGEVKPTEEESPAATAEVEEVVTEPVVTEEKVEVENTDAKNFRLRPQEKLDAEAFRIHKAAASAQAPISMTDALALARNSLGLPDPTATPAKAEVVEGEVVEEEDDSVFDGITQVSAKENLRDLRKQQNAALRDGDLDEAADFGEQIIDAEELIEVLGERETEAAQVATNTRSTEFDHSTDKANELFPDFGNPESAFFAKCEEIDEALATTDDPRYYEADKPLLVAQMAARELNIAPFTGQAAAAPAAAAPAVAQPASASSPQTTSPQPVRTEKPVPMPAASGSSRTGGSTGASKDLQQQIADISNPEDFAAMAKAMGQT